MIIAISTSEFHSLFNQINQLQFLDQGSVPAETTEYFHEWVDLGQVYRENSIHNKSWQPMPLF